MKRKKLRQTWNDQLTSQVGNKVATNDIYETDLERASPAYYERRRKMWTEFHQGDWWIAVAAYLVLSSVAFVVP